LGARALLTFNKHFNLIPKSHFNFIQFDDLVTIEHTKLKQLSVPVIVTSESRKILGFDVCKIPTSGTNAEKSRRKYGFRPNEHPKKLKNLLISLKEIIPAYASFTSDQHKNYNPILRKVFPRSTHIQVKGQRGSVVGQGELKKVCFDPLFSLNHTCAMLRANINRLFRRSWCTTKDPHALKLHIAIYANFHNTRLT